MEDYFSFEKELRGGFVLVTAYYDGIELEDATQKTRDEILSDVWMGLAGVNQLHCILFEYIEAFGLPPLKTTFYTEDVWNTVIDITVGDYTRPQGGKSITISVYSEG